MIGRTRQTFLGEIRGPSGKAGKAASLCITESVDPSRHWKGFSFENSRNWE